MNYKRLFLAFTIIFMISSSLYSAPRTVAVINFTNHTGNNGLQYLSTALPESISSILPQLQDIHVVERSQLTALVKEIELGQTGLFDEKSVVKTGKILQADVLFLGSYTGDASKIILSLKAVDVASGKVLDGKTVKAPLANLFDSANQAAMSIAATITGADTGTLSISTTPDKADIYIDGMLIGNSPIIETKLPAGKHRLKAVKYRYSDSETTITISKDTRDDWNPYLAEIQLKDRLEAGSSVYYMIPFKKDLKAAPLYSILIKQSFRRLGLAGELAYSRIEHNQIIGTPFGEITQERWYQLFGVYGHITFTPFEIGSYLAPYFGAFGGWGYLGDYRKNSSYSDNEQKLSKQNLWNIGPTAGIIIAPFSKVSLFVETRFACSLKKVNRTVFESNGILGGFSEKQTAYRFTALSIGGGLKFQFN